MENLDRYKYTFSLNFCAFYTSVPPEEEEAIKTAVRRLTARNFRYHGISPEDIERLLKVILNRQVFLFNKETAWQWEVH